MHLRAEPRESERRLESERGARVEFSRMNKNELNDDDDDERKKLDHYLATRASARLDLRPVDCGPVSTWSALQL